MESCHLCSRFQLGTSSYCRQRRQLCKYPIAARSLRSRQPPAVGWVVSTNAPRAVCPAECVGCTALQFALAYAMLFPASCRRKRIWQSWWDRACWSAAAPRRWNPAACTWSRMQTAACSLLLATGDHGSNAMSQEARQARLGNDLLLCGVQLLDSVCAARHRVVLCCRDDATDVCCGFAALRRGRRCARRCSSAVGRPLGSRVLQGRPQSCFSCDHS